MPAITQIPVGNQHEMEPVDASVRTPEQHQVVAEIVGSPEFDFTTCNPFQPEVGEYTGPFAFLYYTKDGSFHARRIGKRGSILFSYDS